MARRREIPPLSWGVASIVLGAVGLMLFVIPVLAIPISACGLAAGVLGVVVGLAHSVRELRSALAGVALCCLAVLLNIAVNYAPSGYVVNPAQPTLTSPKTPRPYIAPPARFHGQCAAAMHHIPV